MSFLRARRPMLVAALLGLSLAVAGCDLGGSGHAAGGLQPRQGSGSTHGTSEQAG